LPELCSANEPFAIVTGGFWVQDYINRVAMGRGVEQVLIDIAEENPVYLRLVEIRHHFYMRYIERILEAAQGRIDLVLCGDDFGSQIGPLISPTSFDRLFSGYKREFFDLVHSYGAKITHHCCGSCRMLIPRFIDCGMDALQAVQPRAEGMDPYDLKREFAGQIVLHGGVDVQGWLQKATPEEIHSEMYRMVENVGRGGGFILAPCHHIQPDVPLQNALAIYNAVAKMRS
jgi:uroporphyrinogen decarboxylase